MLKRLYLLFLHISIFGFEITNVYKVNKDIFVEINYELGYVKDVTSEICNLPSIKEAEGFIYLKYIENEKTTIKKIDLKMDCHVE